MMKKVDIPTLRHRAHLAVESILYDLRDRRGLKQEWESIDKSIQDDIQMQWEDLIIQQFIVFDDKEIGRGTFITYCDNCGQEHMVGRRCRDGGSHSCSEVYQ